MPQFVPPAITADDVIRITWFGTLNAQRILWVLHARPSAIFEPVYLTAMASLAEALSADMSAAGGKFGSIRALQSDEFTWDFVQCQRVSPTRDIYFREDINADGGFVGDAASPNLALSVTLRTAFADRHGVGRTQLAGLPVGTLNDGVWGAVTVGNIDSLMHAALTTEFDDPVTNNGYRFGVFATFAVTTEINDIIDVVAHNQARTMHRRTVGLGI